MIDPAQPDFANTPLAPQRIRYGYTLAGVAPPVVSLVTPFYNTGEIFHETAQSVMAQSLQQFEWIIVNDGSTDAAARRVLDVYRAIDARVRVLDLPHNVGSAAARNRGVDAACTQLIAHLDSDDLLEPTALEKWLWFMTSYPEFGAVTSYNVHFGVREWVRQNGFEVGRLILEDNLVGMRSMMRRAVHLAAGGFNEENRQGLIDWEYWLRVAAAGFWGGTVPEPLTWYRRRRGHGRTWPNWQPEGRRLFEQRVRRAHESLWQPGGFPHVLLAPHTPFAPVPDDLPCANLLLKPCPRRLIVCGERTDVGRVVALIEPGHQITIASTAPQDGAWLAAATRHTPDVFIIPNIVRLWDQPRLLRYLAASRQVDEIVICGSALGCLLAPYLRAHRPAARLSLWPGGDATPPALARIIEDTVRAEPPSARQAWLCATQAIEVERLRGAPTCYDGAALARRPLERHGPVRHNEAGHRRPPLNAA